MLVAAEESQSGRAEFAERFDVSRETLTKFDRYAALLTEWQGKYNLIGPSTLPHIWTRHFTDSAQLLSNEVGGERQGRWLDIGSGAGFPGLVLALLGAESVTLCDSVAKKANFLRAVVDELDLSSVVSVQNYRVESMRCAPFAWITARACAPIAKLFDWGYGHQAKSATWLLLKGAAVEEELAAARQDFDFDYRLTPSLTDPRGRIVTASRVRRKRRARRGRQKR